MPHRSIISKTIMKRFLFVITLLTLFVGCESLRDKLSGRGSLDGHYTAKFVGHLILRLSPHLRQRSRTATPCTDADLTLCKHFPTTDADPRQKERECIKRNISNSIKEHPHRRLSQYYDTSYLLAPPPRHHVSTPWHD